MWFGGAASRRLYKTNSEEPYGRVLDLLIRDGNNVPADTNHGLYHLTRLADGIFMDDMSWER